MSPRCEQYTRDGMRCSRRAVTRRTVWGEHRAVCRQHGEWLDRLKTKLQGAS